MGIGGLKFGPLSRSNPLDGIVGSLMTYCVGLKLDRGLVFMADTRTNAGVDNISTFRKLHSWVRPGERVMVLLAAGNLATTQSVVSLLDRREEVAGERVPPVLQTPSMFQAAQLVGDTLKKVISRSGPLAEAVDTFGASFVLGGQIKGSEPRLFLIYPEGNFIEASSDTPFFQIGETKYGKPILIRAYDPKMSFAESIKLLLVSFDSTLKSNLSVGLPLDLLFYERDSFRIGFEKRLEQDDAYLRTISDGWSAALREAFRSLPDFTE